VASSSGSGGKRGKRPSSARLRTLVGGFKAEGEAKGRSKSAELDMEWGEIEHQMTPSTPLAETLVSLIQQTQLVIVESDRTDRDSTPLRVDLSEFGSVGPSYAQNAEGLATRMRDRFDAGDFQGAHDAARALLEREPDDADAKRVEERARSVLLDMFGACLGPLSSVPYLALPLGDVMSLGLDHRAGFVLSQIDGVSAFDDILDVTGMPRLDSMRILCDLLVSKVIALR